MTISIVARRNSFIYNQLAAFQENLTPGEFFPTAFLGFILIDNALECG